MGYAEVCAQARGELRKTIEPRRGLFGNLLCAGLVVAFWLGQTIRVNANCEETIVP